MPARRPLASTPMQSYGPANPYPQPGEVLEGKYRVERLLGEGGMGAVARATHLLRRAPVALKFMSPAVLSLQGAVERFVNEGVAASQIDSDHVVKVFDVGRLPNGAPYLVMEFLDGLDLGQVIARDGPLIDPARAVHFTVQALRALQTAHLAGIIHRDMKPSNCFVITKDGEPDFVKLVDFGISKVRSTDDGQAPQLTRTNSALGTPLYMSPEQARSPRDVDHRTDLYSVGAILYEMLAGRTPYTAESGEYTEILFKIFTTEPDPIRQLRPEIPEALSAAIHRSLTRDRDARYASAADMAEALAPFADNRSSLVLSRFHGTRGRSLLPGSSALSPSVPAPSPQAGPVRAQTFPTGHDVGRAAIVPTDVGVTRETATAGAGKRSHLGLIAGVGVVALAAAAAGVLVTRTRTPGHTEIKREPPPSVTVAPPPPESATLPPIASTAATPSASVAPPPSASVVAVPPRPPAVHTAGPNPPLPTKLGDLKIQ